MKTTAYFQESVLLRRPYLKEEWLLYTIENPAKTERQANGRYRYWAYIEELGKYLRVVVEPDGETVHNAFPDRRFKG